MDVPAQRYSFPEEDVEEVLARLGALLRSGAHLTQAAYVAEFEAEFARKLGAAHAVAVSSGTAALEIVLRAVGVAGGEVVVPTNTFAATAFAALRAGANVVFADCGDDLGVDPADVARRITERTKAIVVVHVGGFVSPALDELRRLADDRGLPLVEDAAHAHGSRWAGRCAGTLGAAAAFSFFPTKVMTTGEGGMVVTDDEAIADLARELRDQGKLRNRNLHRQVGYNWRMPEVAAILGLSQLKRLDEFILRRSLVAAAYDSVLESHEPLVRRLRVPEASEPNHYKYVVVVPGAEAEVVGRLLGEAGVTLAGFVYDVPCHLQPVFQSHRDGALPRAEWLATHHVCLPIYPDLDPDTACEVADALVQVAEACASS